MTNNSIVLQSDTSVLNGTEIISANLSLYLDRYRTFAKQTAESFLGLAATLVEAKEKLNPVDFTLFCNNINLEKDGSTYKKIFKIGSEIARFQPVVELLPNSWTTIYDLAKIDKNKFLEIANSNILSPTMTALELKKALTQDSQQKNIIKDKNDISIKLNHLSVEDKIKVYELIFNIKSDYPFEIKIDENLESELVNFKTRQAA
jgi:hypothetical protein